jgi:hypothetical protein
MKDGRFIIYQTIQRHASSGVDHRVAVHGNPHLSMLIERNLRGLFLLVPYSQDCDQLVDRFDVIKVSRIDHGGENLLKIGTDRSELIGPVLTLLCDIADRIQLDGQETSVAVNETIDRWRGLLTSTPMLSGEAERGLLGELWLLERLIASRGPEALDTWHGPLGELHDFSMGQHGIEVKTTLSRERIHVVSNLQQLEPSEGTNLFVLSLQLRPDGTAGSPTLPEAIDLIAEQLRTDQTRAAKFADLVRRVGYDEKHRSRFASRYRLRTKPVLVRVDERFPAITRVNLAAFLGGEVSGRVVDVEYTISLDQLGHEDGSHDFLQLIPMHSSRVIP